MSLKKKAAQVRAKGKKNIGQDSMLAHINPEEAALLKARGGSGQIDPDTGIPHFATSGGDGAGGGDGNDGNGGFGGGWGGGLDGAPDSGTMGGGGYGTANDGDTGDGTEGWGGAGGTGLSSVFNAAMDSQMANEENGFEANSSFESPSFDPSPAWSSPTEQGWTLDRVMKNPFAKALMSLNPVTKAVQVGYGMLNAKSPMDAASQALGAFGGPIGSLAASGINAATSSNPAGAIGQNVAGRLGGMVGNAIGGPVGGAIGGLAGGFAAGQGMAGQGSANAGAQGNTGSQASQGGIDYSALANGLGGLYANYRAGQQANSAADSLKDLYSPGGAYAQQLRQTLERKDAAGGRRSQYGPREAQMQAMLADKYAGNVMNMNKLQQSGLRSNGQLMSTGLNMLNKTGLLNKGVSYLGNMFNDGNGNGNGGFSSGGTSYNNPSAYSAPSNTPEPNYMMANDASSDDYWS